MMALVAISARIAARACERETDTAAPAARPVRTVTVEKREMAGRLPLPAASRLKMK